MKVNIGKYPKRTPRRIKIEIEKFDTWGLDHTLSHIIYPALLQLKATKQGVPTDFAEVGGENYVDQLSFPFYHDTQAEMFDEKITEWDVVLDKMIWSFKQLMMDDYDELYHHGDAGVYWEESGQEYLNPITHKLEKTYKMNHKNNYFFDAEGLKKHEEQIQEGLDLFAKYYRNLWD